MAGRVVCQLMKCRLEELRYSIMNGFGFAFCAENGSTCDVDCQSKPIYRCHSSSDVYLLFFVIIHFSRDFSSFVWMLMVSLRKKNWIWYSSLIYSMFELNRRQHISVSLAVTSKTVVVVEITVSILLHSGLAVDIFFRLKQVPTIPLMPVLYCNVMAT